jgi:cardiolipin synthase
VLWRVASARVSGGNAVRLLCDGPATFDAMLSRIASARASVDLESYIVRDDAVGREVASALVDAVRRGVRARLLTDGVGSRAIGARFVATLRRAGVAVAVFNRPHPFHAWLGVLPRDHRKLLVVDGRVGIIGGVGIGREWRPGPGALAGTQWRDTAVEIEGAAADDMSAAFDAMWRATTGRPRGPGHHIRAPARPPSAPLVPAMVGIVEGLPWRLRVARAFQFEALTAQRRLWIADAYFMPSPAEVEALLGAARDGVDVRLLVPSRNDHTWMLRLTRRYYRALLAGGVRVWEWRGAMMHAKTSVIDGHRVRVGSTDFNPLGLAINYELDALIEDRALGAAAERTFEADLEASREVTRAAG